MIKIIKTAIIVLLLSMMLDEDSIITFAFVCISISIWLIVLILEIKFYER